MSQEELRKLPPAQGRSPVISSPLACTALAFCWKNHRSLRATQIGRALLHIRAKQASRVCQARRSGIVLQKNKPVHAKEKNRNRPLIPDNPRKKDSNWAWRRLAALNGLGTSFRQGRARPKPPCRLQPSNLRRACRSKRFCIAPR